MGELALIESIRAGWGGRTRPNSGVTLGIGDDCALLRPPAGHELALTTDLLLEGRHFRRNWHPPRSVGHRALARGLSDLASMGAKPMAAFLSLALPPGTMADKTGQRWVADFFAGLRDLGRQYGIALAGGDTAQSPAPLVLADIVLVGSVRAGHALRRSGGRPGDLLYVTGKLGGSAAELDKLAEHPCSKPARIASTDHDLHPQLFPQPRVRVGRELVRRKLATAAIDLSDGISTDLAHLCAESGTGAEIYETALPLHPLAIHRGANKALALALHGGEDYELLFTSAPGIRVPRSIAGVPITRIGQLTRKTHIRLLRTDGTAETLRAAGWEHLL